jgi:hypothetical protein
MLNIFHSPQITGMKGWRCEVYQTVPRFPNKSLLKVVAM